MNWLKLPCLVSSYLLAQLPPELPKVLEINQCVNRITTDKNLTISQIVYHQSNKKPVFDYPIIAGGDTIFYTWYTDFPCSALLSHSGNDLVKVKEVVNAGSCFAVNQYYLINNKLIFVEAKEILCEFSKQSSKKVYTEKDYIFHGKYYFAGDSCIQVKEHGQSRYGIGRLPIPTKMPAQPRAYFYHWQATRYVTLFDHRPKRH
jgi:hypothetical protein